MPISSLLLSLTLVLPLSGAKEQGLVALTPGKTLESSVEDGDEAITTEKLAGGYVDQPVLGKSFTLTVKTAGTWRLDLVGHAFDGYLVLRDAQGALVAEDDDGLVGVHARIVAELAAGQPYVVQAGALHGGRGTFELVAREGAPDPRESVPWSEREIEARIRTVFEQEKWKKVDVVQSKRYLVLTDSGAGKKFGKILDKDIYEGFFDLYGIELPEPRRPLIVYLFNTRDDYIEFLMRTFNYSRGKAAQSGGIAYSDFYTTSYTSPRDSIHFHECAHQIMRNVLGLGGGGSWYQEGVAENYQDKIDRFNRRAETRMAIRTGQSVPLRELFGARSMLYSAGANTRGGGGASGMYGQAASVILFLSEGPRKKRFQDFLFRMGKVDRSDLEQIEQVLLDVYELTIEGLEAEWKEYFAG